MKDLDSDLDLTLERRLMAPPAKVWRALTEPDLLRQWFAPRPWKVVEVIIDPRPGGRFHTRMAGPDGESEDCAIDDDPGGCILVAEPERRLVWTDALSEDFRPNPSAFMTADVRLAPDESGTLYRVRVLHKDDADAEKHRAMGFDQGWGTCSAQLDELARTL